MEWTSNLKWHCHINHPSNQMPLYSTKENFGAPKFFPLFGAVSRPPPLLEGRTDPESYIIHVIYIHTQSNAPPLTVGLVNMITADVSMFHYL